MLARREHYCDQKDVSTCVLCELLGKLVEPGIYHLHHIFPRSAFPALTFTPWNTVFLCREHHSEQTRSEMNLGFLTTAKKLYRKLYGDTIHEGYPL